SLCVVWLFQLCVVPAVVVPLSASSTKRPFSSRKAVTLANAPGWRFVSVTAVRLPNLAPLTIETACPREDGGPFSQHHKTRIYMRNSLLTVNEGTSFLSLLH
ncbi:MAG: hypothetical protein GY805_29275, partial [Chloroflexi bacterium]|nr:hypothetical protein [Chloroflexota bacterium]